jgi:hypothetical protein
MAAEQEDQRREQGDHPSEIGLLDLLDPLVHRGVTKTVKSCHATASQGAGRLARVLTPPSQHLAPCEPDRDFKDLMLAVR